MMTQCYTGSVRARMRWSARRAGDRDALLKACDLPATSGASTPPPGTETELLRGKRTAARTIHSTVLVLRLIGGYRSSGSSARRLWHEQAAANVR